MVPPSGQIQMAAPDDQIHVAPPVAKYKWRSLAANTDGAP